MMIFSSAVRGQEFVFSEPMRLDENINSSAEEVYPLLSADGRVLFFVRSFYKGNVGGKNAGQDIWYTRRNSSGRWGYPINLIELNSSSNNVVVGTGEADTILYLQNTYSDPLSWDYGIAFSSFEKDKWSDPKELNLKFNSTGSFKGYYVNPKADIILMSTENEDNSYGKEDLYLYRKVNGLWTEPFHFNENINTRESEISPFLSSDEKWLFFASNGHMGFGDFDLYASQRMDTSWTRWGTAINLGSKINSSGFEAYMTTYEDGETFFSSTKNSDLADIYTTTLNVQEIAKTEETLPATQKVSKETQASLQPAQNSTYQEIAAKKSNLTGAFTVQILAMSRGVRPRAHYFSMIDHLTIKKSEGRDGLDRFYVGEYSSLSDAYKAMENLRYIGYKDAFVRRLTEYAGL